MNTSTTIIIAKIAIAGPVLAAGALFYAPLPSAYAAPPNVVMEDDPGWDCRIMGNRVCGPDNMQGVPAGDYSVGGR